VPEEAGELVADYIKGWHQADQQRDMLKRHAKNPTAAQRALACRCPAQRANTAAAGAVANVSRRTKPVGSTSAHRAERLWRGGNARRVWMGSERCWPFGAVTSRQSRHNPRGVVGAGNCLGFSCSATLVIGVIPRTEDGFALINIAADAMQINHPAATDFHGWDGIILNPAPYNVRRDQLRSHHVNEGLCRAERRIAVVSDAFRVAQRVEAYYPRLFHDLYPIIGLQTKKACPMCLPYVQILETKQRFVHSAHHGVFQ
jgi:hypothetical protein